MTGIVYIARGFWQVPGKTVGVCVRALINTITSEGSVCVYVCVARGISRVSVFAALCSLAGAWGGAEAVRGRGQRPALLC